MFFRYAVYQSEMRCVLVETRSEIGESPGYIPVNSLCFFSTTESCIKRFLTSRGQKNTGLNTHHTIRLVSSW